jgi:hypothetical protein
VHYLRYLLDNDPTAATGAYGFFARLIGPPYETSDPLLIVLNNGLDESTLLTAALAINAAAGEGASLAGDYNQNGIVDASDFVLWRETLGSVNQLAADGNGNHLIDTADYDVWRANFGQTGPGGSTALLQSGLSQPANFGMVPEPGTCALAAGAILASFVVVRQRVRYPANAAD